MAFEIRTEKRGAVSGLDSTIWILQGNGNRAEIWPARGFNCFHWGLLGMEFLFADQQFLDGSSPTRTGVPILFPFPNRIRDGRFTWEGKEFRLPINDPQKKNAIHGFACPRPWRVVNQGADTISAWITGEFWGSRDAPECQSLWPADYRIQMTYRLSPGRLRIEAKVDNPDQSSLPFGLGFHPYFRAHAEDCQVRVPARHFWELAGSLPSGTRMPVATSRDLNQFRSFEGLTLDDVLTDLPTASGPEALCFRGRIRDGATSLAMFTSASFQEMVVFTPPHRQAFCMEPYTCTTDAINLQQRGVDAGLIVLPPGQSWTGIVEIRYQTVGRESDQA